MQTSREVNAVKGSNLCIFQKDKQVEKIFVFNFLTLSINLKNKVIKSFILIAAQHKFYYDFRLRACKYLQFYIIE